MFIALIVLEICLCIGMFYCLPVTVREGIQCIKEIYTDTIDEQEV